MSEQGGAGRYTRSFNGMIGAMIFLVALVLLLVMFRALISDPPEGGRPPAVDYRDLVQGLQQNGFDPVYPETLPEGWAVTEVSADLGEAPSYRVNLFTAEDSFVGIRQQDADAAELEDLLTQYVGEDLRTDEPLEGVGDLATTWEAWSDSGGDHAYSAVVDGDTVLVYGDVGFEELADLVGRLGTTEITTTG